jgi:hypothetical protein
MKYKKKPVLTEATQWFQNGDHPQDNTHPINRTSESGRMSEGEIVGFFRSLNIPGGRFCTECGKIMQEHGMMNRDTAVTEDAIVHPGDYIVTHPSGKFYPVRQEDFERMFEPYESELPEPITPDPGKMQ